MTSKLVREGRMCPYCNSKTKLIDTAEIYHGHHYGYAWACVEYPNCDAYVGTHKANNLPLGRLANAELREAKKKAHTAFDPVWRTGGMSRSYMYQLLSDYLEIPSNQCHIGMFDVDLCNEVVEFIQAYHSGAVQTTPK